jgi:hypothetical protein
MKHTPTANITNRATVTYCSALSAVLDESITSVSVFSLFQNVITADTSVIDSVDATESAIESHTNPTSPRLVKSTRRLFFSFVFLCRLVDSRRKKSNRTLIVKKIPAAGKSDG